MLQRSAREVEGLRTAYAALQARDFATASAVAAPLAASFEGALLHGLALAGLGEVAQAAPILARIARANPAARHPVQDLLPLLPPGAGLQHIRAGLELLPDDARLLALLGTALADAGPMDQALDAFRRVTSLRPDEAAGWANLGKALSACCAFDDADQAFATARGLAPADKRLRFHHAVMLLKSGRLDQGWPAFSIRHALPDRPRPLPGPRLEDLTGVAGRTVLLEHDEGFGDTLHFIRYAKLLAERGARVVARMPPPLTRLVATVDGISEVAAGLALPRYDAWCPVVDLPLLFGTTLATIPAGAPYLHAEPAPGLPPGPKAGLVWAGDRNSALDAIRSMDPALLAPLRDVPGFIWVSLQYGAAAPGWMIDPMPGVTDFANTAAIVAALDVVVTVDSAMAHLAGGMGKKVLLLDRYDNCWRWLGGRTDSPWYPTMRIVRQATPGDWPGVVAAAAALLPGFSGSRPNA